MTEIVVFLSGAGVSICAAYLYVLRVRGGLLAQLEAIRTHRDQLMDVCHDLHTEVNDLGRSAVAAITSRRVSDTPADTPGSVSDTPANTHADDQLVTWHDPSWWDYAEREALRCAAVREEYSRDHCFDPQCPRCFPRTVVMDPPTMDDPTTRPITFDAPSAVV